MPCFAAFCGTELCFCGTELWVPKPVIPTNVLAPKPPCLVQTPCAKTAKSCAFCDCTPEFYGGILYWLLEKQGKLYFLQSSQTKGRDVLAAFATRFCLRHCVFLCKGTKLQNSAKPNSRTVCRFPPWYAFLPLIPAVWGFGLGLLGGQGFIGAKASLDPLCRALRHRASFWHRNILF